MQGTGATKGNQRIVARVMTLLDGHQTQSPDHVFVHNVVDTKRRIFNVLAQSGADFFDRSMRQLAVEFHVAAQTLHLRHVAQYNRSVCHSRFRATTAIRGWARISTSRLRPNAQCFGQLGHMCDGATTGTDGTNVDRRGAHRDVADGRFTTQSGLAIHDQRDVGGRAAHIDRQQVRKARLQRNPDRTTHTTGRTGHQQVDRKFFRGLGRGQPTIRAQNMQINVRAFLSQFGLQVAYVFQNARSDIGIGDRRDRAFVLLHFRYDFGRQGDRNPRQLLGRNRLDPPLMRIIGISIDERHRQRLNVLGLECTQRDTQGVFVEAFDNFAARTDALIGLNGAGQRR